MASLTAYSSSSPSSSPTTSSPSSSPTSQIDPPYRYTKRFFYDKTVKKTDAIRLFQGVKNAVGVGSISEMAATLKKAPTKEVPSMIVVAGHGGPSHQGLGSSQSRGYLKGRDFHKDHLDDISEEIETIRNVLRPQQGSRAPILFFSGCDVGQDPALGKKLSAKLKGVCVITCKNRLDINVLEGEEEGAPNQVFFQRLQNSKPSTFQAQMVYAFNGKIIKSTALKALTGHSPKELYPELMLHGDEPDLEFETVSTDSGDIKFSKDEYKKEAVEAEA